MSAYDNQLQAAISHLGDANPLFDFNAADEDVRYRQLKTWWSRPLAEDLRHGHNTSGPITVAGDLSDRQSVLLSFLQRPLRADRGGDWTVTAEPAEGESLQLTLTGYGFTVSALVQETGGSVATAGISTSSDFADSSWPARMLFRNTFLEAPAGDLVDALALAAAFSQSPFAKLAGEIRRTGPDLLDALDIEVDLDWSALEARPYGDAGKIAAASGLAEDQVEEELGAVLRRAVELGHAVPAARKIAAPPPLPVAAAAGGGVLPEGHPARSVLDSLGIDLSNTQVVGVGPGSGISMEIGMDSNGNLSINDNLPTVGMPAAPVSPEEEFAGAVADILGISREQLKDILDEDEDAA